MLDRPLMRAAMEELEGLRNDLLDARRPRETAHPRYQSLLNLRQYLILRSRDWTELQEKLFLLSLSSLGRSYAHVAASIDTLYDQLSSSLGLGEISAEEMAAFHHLSIAAAQETIVSNSMALFGEGKTVPPESQRTAVMVTLPSQAATDDGALVRGLASAGVNVFRINTAHDDAAAWAAMAETIRGLNAERGPDEALKIFVDLAGPKIRTGRLRRLALPITIGSNKREKPVLILPAPAVTRGEMPDPQTRKLHPAQIAVDPVFFEALREGDVLKLKASGGKHSRIVIQKREGDSAVGIIAKKVPVDEQSIVRYAKRESAVLNCERVADPIRLFKGDLLRITEEPKEGRSAVKDEAKGLVTPAQIHCSLEGFASHVSVGERIYIDDGKIGLEAVEIEPNAILCRVVLAKENGTLLKEEKGINLPDTHLAIPALTETDRENVLKVFGFADMLGLSFCQGAEDIAELQHFLTAHDAAHIGIVAKIETRPAVSRMPAILEQLLAWEKSGVMIARGDLAIEVGFENLATIQESLLDICNAAHIPVIWATQVLESQMKSNLPSRAEITDAAMAGRAECVMLNKGPFAIDTAGALLRILDMMHQSFRKNRQLLRKEELWAQNAANASVPVRNDAELPAQDDVQKA
jgi:pyruvate kinase